MKPQCCMDADMLISYIEKRLPEQKKDLMEEHLLECDECLEEFALAKTLVNTIDLVGYEPASEAVVRNVLNSIREKIENLVRWITELPPPEWLLNYGASPVRSGRSEATSTTASVLVRKKVDDLQAEMYIQKTKPDKVCIWIKVSKGRRTAKNVSLTLTKDGGRPLARFLTTDYEFFDKLSFGTYALVLEQNARKKGDLLFQIDDKGFCQAEACKSSLG
ncbi:MAG: hypothetical protein GY795_28170 [Desulfobacterales bacterium]|nr:hypothetical protein [Desulfobacterales bacterium]